jgi:hypothetical protein
VSTKVLKSRRREKHNNEIGRKTMGVLRGDEKTMSEREERKENRERRWRE